jgi:hypothetical protein
MGKVKNMDCPFPHAKKLYQIPVYNEDTKQWQILMCNEKLAKTIQKSADELHEKHFQTPIVTISNI